MNFYADSKLLLSIVHPDDRKRVADMLPDLIEKGSMKIVYRIMRPDGEVRWLEDRATVIRNAEGKPMRFDGVVTDITTQKASEAKK